MDKDILLINDVKKDRNVESLKELIDRHSGIYVEMVNKHIPNDLEGVNKEDLIQDKDFSIYEAAINFDENKNTKFGTYVGNLARWKCLNIYNKKIKFPQMNISDIFDTKVSEEDAIKKITTDDFYTNLSRPKWTPLNPTKFERAFGEGNEKIPTYEEDIQNYLREMGIL